MPNHCVDLQVRFSDTDMLGHVNNASFASWAEIGRLQFFASLGEFVRGWILASLYVDYRRQVEYTDRARIETWIERLGTSSIATPDALPYDSNERRSEADDMPGEL
jgi:acyl-CoA thioester hydrolase